MIRKTLALIVLSLATCTANVFGCSCGTGGTPSIPTEAELRQRILNSADFIFEGTVDSFEFRDAPLDDFQKRLLSKNPGLIFKSKIAKFSVDRWWNGNLEANALLLTGEITVSDGSTIRNDCTGSFQKSQKYLIFATNVNGKLVSSACSYTNKEWVRPYLGEGNTPVARKDMPVRPL